MELLFLKFIWQASAEAELPPVSPVPAVPGEADKPHCVEEAVHGDVSNWVIFNELMERIVIFWTGCF